MKTFDEALEYAFANKTIKNPRGRKKELLEIFKKYESLLSEMACSEAFNDFLDVLHDRWEEIACCDKHRLGAAFRMGVVVGIEMEKTDSLTYRGSEWRQK